MASRSQEPDALPRRPGVADSRPLRNRLQYDNDVQDETKVAARNRF